MSEPTPTGKGSSAGKPIRPKKLLERPWPWLILAGLIGGAVFALRLPAVR